MTTNESTIDGRCLYELRYAEFAVYWLHGRLTARGLEAVRPLAALPPKQAPTKK